MASIAVETHNLTVSYNRKPVLWSVDFAIPQGQLGCIVGPNGAGKSTLLKAILGLVKVESGYAHILGKDIDEVRNEITYVPQKESVDWSFPISVKEVVEMGVIKSSRWWVKSSRDDKEVVMKALDQVNLLPFANRQISQLSGGQQQRVFIARALAQKAQIIFMDEPFAGVDRATEEMIVELMQNLAKENKTLLVVHHDLQTVERYFTYGIMLNSRLIAAGPLSTIYTPENLKRTFGGKLNILTDVEQLIKNKQIETRLGH